MIKPGEVLRNGAVVIASKLDLSLNSIVLAMWKMPEVEYVTWCVTSDGAACHGNYFLDICSAVKDYQERGI
jgi:hypothetical protein